MNCFCLPGVLQVDQPAKVTGLLKQAYATRGEAFIDRRGQQDLRNNRFKYQQIAEPVALLVDAGSSIRQAAEQFGVDPATARKAYNWLHRTNQQAS